MIYCSVCELSAGLVVEMCILPRETLCDTLPLSNVGVKALSMPLLYVLLQSVLKDVCLLPYK